jgi:hypothetical protein
MNAGLAGLCEGTATAHGAVRPQRRRHRMRFGAFARSDRYLPSCVEGRCRPSTLHSDMHRPACSDERSRDAADEGDVYSWGRGAALGHRSGENEPLPRLIDALRCGRGPAACSAQHAMWTHTARPSEPLRRRAERIPRLSVAIQLARCRTASAQARSLPLPPAHHTAASRKPSAHARE